MSPSVAYKNFSLGESASPVGVAPASDRAMSGRSRIVLATALVAVSTN